AHKDAQPSYLLVEVRGRLTKRDVFITIPDRLEREDTAGKSPPLYTPHPSDWNGMRSWACQFGLSFAVLIAWPLLGAGTQAQAAFLVRTPTESGVSSGMSAGTERDSGQRTPETPAPARLLTADSPWAGLTPTGASFGGTPSGASGSVGS